MGGREAEAEMAMTIDANVGNFLPSQSYPIEALLMNHYTPTRAPPTRLF